MSTKMDEASRRQTIRISALGTAYDMVYREWSREDVGACPVVICVHGTPATDGTFRRIACPLAAKGYRVLAVNFPGMGLTKVDRQRRYDFSAPHKAALIKAFIIALQLKSVAMIIGHSAGCHAIARLLADHKVGDIVQSACFICTVAMTPHKLYKSVMAFPQHHVINLLYRIMYLPVIGPLVISPRSDVVRRLIGRSGRAGLLAGMPPETKALTYYEVGHLNFDQFGRDLAVLSERRLPILLLNALDDGIVEFDLMPQVTRVLNIPDEDIKYSDENFHSEHIFSDDTLRRAVRFETGSHFLLVTKATEVSNEILSFLDALANGNRTNVDIGEEDDVKNNSVATQHCEGNQIGTDERLLKSKI